MIQTTVLHTAAIPSVVVRTTVTQAWMYRVLFANMVIQWYKPLIYRLLLSKTLSYSTSLHKPLPHSAWLSQYTLSRYQTLVYNMVITSLQYIQYSKKMEKHAVITVWRVQRDVTTQQHSHWRTTIINAQMRNTQLTLSNISADEQELLTHICAIQTIITSQQRERWRTTVINAHIRNTII